MPVGPTLLELAVRVRLHSRRIDDADEIAGFVDVFRNGFLISAARFHANSTCFGDSPTLRPFLQGPTSLLIVRNAFPEMLLPRVEQSQAQGCRSDNDSNKINATLDVFGVSPMIVNAGPYPDMMGVGLLPGWQRHRTRRHG